MPKKQEDVVRLVPPELPKGEEPPFEISTSDFSGGTTVLKLEADGSYVTSDQEVIRILTTRHGYTSKPTTATPSAVAQDKES